jgi:predicted nucleic acid-binding protein
MVFVDGSAWIAVMHQKDQYHQSAASYFDLLLDSGERFLTTNWTLYEAYTFLKTHAGYEKFNELYVLIQRRRTIYVERINKSLETAALDVFVRYRDKTWGVVDCANLIVMQLSGCNRAFAYDTHFRQAARQYGFRVEG